MRRAGDGKLVVIHDETVDRTTNGRGRVADLSYDEIKQFDAGFGEPIPLLFDVLDQFGSQCLLNIELKEAGLAPDIKRLLVEMRLETRVIDSSFDWDELLPFAPEVPTAPLSSKLDNLIPVARNLGSVAIHPRKDLVTPTVISAARDAKLRIHVWTVNEPAEISHFRELGVDGIFSDFPERCLMSAS